MYSICSVGEKTELGMEEDSRGKDWEQPTPTGVWGPTREDACAEVETKTTIEIIARVAKRNLFVMMPYCSVVTAKFKEKCA